MRGTSRFTGRASRGIGIRHSRRVAVFLVPRVFSPNEFIGKGSVLVFHFGTVFMAKFLSEFDRTRRTGFHAFSARHAFFLRYLRGIRASRKVGRVEQQRRSERVANFHVTVTDVENLIFSVDIRYLMNVSVLFRKLQYFQSPFFGYVMRSAGFHGIVRHIAELYAPIVYIVGTAIAEHGARSAARTDSRGDMSVVFVEPVRDMFEVNRLIFRTDCLFYGDNVHSYAVAARGHHLSDSRKRNKRHSFKERCNRGVLLYTVDGGIEKFRRAGYEKRNAVSLYTRFVFEFAVMVVIVAVIVFENADIGHFFEKIAERDGFVVLVHFEKLLESIEFTQLHFVRNVAHLGSENFFKSPIFGRFGTESREFMRHDVRDFFAEFNVAFIDVFFALILADDFIVLFWHSFSPSIPKRLS